MIRLDLPHFACVIPDVLSARTCEHIIADLEARGFSDMHTNKHGEKFHDPAFRSDQCVSFIDPEFANDLFDRVRAFLPATATGLHTRLRCSKYVPGTSCIPHRDDAIEVRNTKSQWTILLYLNTDVRGATRLWDRDAHIDVKPIAGTVLVFDQRLRHEALSPARIKYTVRTDVMKAVVQRTRRNAPRPYYKRSN